MTDPEYDRWVNRHSALFGFCHPGDPAMFKQWRVEFERRRVTAGELESASSEIARLEQPLKWREHYLAFINSHVNKLRRIAGERRRLKEEANTGISKCQDCGDSGLMSVPHWKCVSEGVWDGTWVTIGCHCFAGKALQERYTRFELNDTKMVRYRPMTFERYCELNPDFRAQVRDHQEASELAFESRRAAQGQDAAAGPLAKVIDKAMKRAGA